MAPAKTIPRLYEAVLKEHLRRHRQMAFVSGPRQVGKTTSCRGIDRRAGYFSWDDQDDRRAIVAGPRRVAEQLGLERLHARRPVVVFDEIHKYARWKTFLKGLFDRYADQIRVVVTGSSRLDVYRRGGDSLMGRYLSYRMHPLSVGELLRARAPARAIRKPAQLGEADFDALWTHGGFPEPFVKRNKRFSRRWQQLRFQQLVREDVRDLTQIQELSRIELLVTLLGQRSGEQLSYSSIAREINVSVDTARRWVAALCSLHLGFLVRPWFRNVAKSLRKEPKWYLYDWSNVDDAGRKAETFVACHLIKAVHVWEVLGLGGFSLHYLRDRQKREVDFVVVQDGQPWFLVEVKQGDTWLSPALQHFRSQIGARNAFQAVIDLPHVAANCFDRRDPCVVPARTLLSQLP